MHTVTDLKRFDELNEMEDIEEHKNDIKVSVAAVYVEREKELELVEKLVDLVSAVARKART